MNNKIINYSLSLLLLLFVFILFFSMDGNSQNVGVGTTTPTHSFHVVRPAGNPAIDPLRVEGIQNTKNDSAFLVIDNSGVVRYVTLFDLKNQVVGDLDSLIVSGLILNADTLFSSSAFSDSLRSYIYNNADTILMNNQWLSN